MPESTSDTRRWWNRKPGEDDPVQQVWRQWLSEGFLVRIRQEERSIPGGGKTDENVQQKVEGFAPVVITTTKDLKDLNDEFANRLNNVESNDDRETTGLVLQRQAELACDPKKYESEFAAEQSRWREFDQSLEPLGVVIPFSEHIILESRHVASRRLFPHVMDHVKVSALIHQHQRDRDSSGSLIATCASSMAMLQEQESWDSHSSLPASVGCDRLSEARTSPLFSNLFQNQGWRTI